MAFSLDILNRLPAYQRWLILLGLMVLIGVGYYFGIYTGKKTELKKQEQSLAKLEKNLQKLEETKKNLAAFEAKAKKLEVELGILEIEIPKSSEIPDILSYISTSGKESGLDFLLFKPGKEKKIKDKNYIEVPVSISVKGTYNSFAVFLDKVRTLDRIINVRNINMKRSSLKGGNVILQISCTAVTFKFPK